MTLCNTTFEDCTRSPRKRPVSRYLTSWVSTFLRADACAQTPRYDKRDTCAPAGGLWVGVCTRGRMWGLGDAFFGGVCASVD